MKILKWYNIFYSTQIFRPLDLFLYKLNFKPTLAQSIELEKSFNGKLSRVIRSHTSFSVHFSYMFNMCIQVQIFPQIIFQKFFVRKPFFAWKMSEKFSRLIWNFAWFSNDWITKEFLLATLSLCNNLLTFFCNHI